MSSEGVLSTALLYVRVFELAQDVVAHDVFFAHPLDGALSDSFRAFGRTVIVVKGMADLASFAKSE